MKVLMYHAPGKLEIEDHPIPNPGNGELLVRVRASGVCSGETMDWYMESKAPLVPGHEPAGEVVEVGPGVDNFEIGDRVFVHHHVPCMDCHYCERGLYTQCPMWKEKQIYPGAMAEYMLVKERAVKVDTLKLPEDVSYESGALIEPVACSVKALKSISITDRSRVLVVGLGFMGIVNALIAKHYGAGLIAGLDLKDWRISKAISLGITNAENPLNINTEDWAMEITSGNLFDVVVVGPGNPEVIKSSLDLVSPGGSLIVFTPTPPDSPTEVDFNSVYFKEIRIIPSYSSGPEDTREALSLIASGVINPDELITHRFTLEDAPHAYELAREANESLKIMVIP